MFFIVRSFLIPFGAPRRVGAPGPAQRRRPPPAPLQALGGTSRRGFLLSPPPALPHSASPGMALPSQPRFLNHHPYHPAQALLTAPSRLEEAPGLPSSPRHQPSSLLPPPAL